MHADRGRIKRRVHSLLSVAETGDRASSVVDTCLATLIVLNVAAAILQTVEGVYRPWRFWFDGFEVLSVAVFSVEYALRLWSGTADERYRDPIIGRLRLVVTPMLLIDLLAIAPFYLSSVMTLDLRMLRAIRLIRLARVLKIARYSESLRLLGRVFVAKRNELFVTLIAVAVLLVLASTLIYHAERDIQPDKFSSIPAAMWWGVETLTTVGYGDMCPVTATGKAIGMLVSILGIGLFALPAGILGSGFVSEMRRKQAISSRCPHCGQPIHGGAEIE